MDKQEIFPDGTVIDKWFYDITIPELSDLGKQYVLTDNNVLDDGKIHTKEIQNLIDRAYENGGRVIVCCIVTDSHFKLCTISERNISYGCVVFQTRGKSLY